jgi:hypothetical protein
MSTSADMEELLRRLEDVQASLQRMADERERLRAEREAQGPGNQGYINAEGLDPADRERGSTQVAQGEPGGDPVGAAQESNRGPGDFAGEGTQDLELGEPPIEAQAPLGAGTEVQLPDDLASAGERIERDFTPQTEYTEVPDIRSSAEVVTAEPANTGYRHEVLGPLGRLVASRYFEPVSENDIGSQ